MYELITLAITETFPNTDEFSVVAYDVKSKNILSFDLVRDQIVSTNGEVMWDIGFTTFVDEIRIRESKYGNEMYEAFKVKLANNSIDLLKKILEAKVLNGDKFFVNTKERYAIVKVNEVEDISIDKKTESKGGQINKYRIKANITCLKEAKEFLNKDYRWVHYWNWIIKNSEFENKRKKYLDLLNRKDKELYFILYRHKFQGNSSRYWISGMHWL